MTKASAVGQKLACPKCGTMIQVTPPEGWTPPPSESAEHSQSYESQSFDGDSLGGNFDDIENILANPHQVAPASSKKQRPATPLSKAPAPKKKKTSTSSPQRPTTVAASAANGPKKAAAHQSEAGPILPNDQWTGAATRKKKQVVLLVVGIAGSVLLLGAVLAAVVYNSRKPDTVASNNGTNEAIVTPENPESDANADSDNESNTEDASSDENAADANDASNNPKGDDSATEPSPDDNPVDANKPPAIITDSDAPAIPDPANPAMADATTPAIITNADGSPTDSPPENDQDIGNVQSPFAAQGDNNDTTGNQDTSPFNVEPPATPTKPTAGIVEELENDLGDLSALLQQRGSSLTEFRDVASQVNAPKFVGMPKYVLLPGEPERELDLEKRLAYPVGGLKYEAVPLMTVLRNIEAISGIPITLDVRSMVMGSLPTNPEITVTITDSTVDESLDKILTPLGLTRTPLPLGIVVGHFPSHEMSKKEFELPNIPDLSDDQRKRFVATIREFVYPGAWILEENPATIELVDNTVVVNCPPVMHAQTDLLLSKLRSAYTLTKDPANAESLANTQSRWKAISPQLAKDPNLKPSIQTKIGAFFTKLQTATGVSVIVDWPAVSFEGWSPQTDIPGNIQEASMDEAMKHLAESMRLVVVAVDASTLVLTSPERSAEWADLEVYPVGKILSAGSFNEKQILRLIDNSLGSQLQSNSVRYIYNPSCQCIIVLGNQLMQRQIEALLDQMGGI